MDTQCRSQRRPSQGELTVIQFYKKCMKYFGPLQCWEGKAINEYIYKVNEGEAEIVCNRPFYRYGGHIELIRIKEYYRTPRGHEHSSFVFSSPFRDIFFLKFSQNKIVMGKKILVPCLDVIMIAFFQFSIRNMVFHCMFLGKKAIIITSKHGTRIFFLITVLS